MNDFDRAWYEHVLAHAGESWVSEQLIRDAEEWMWMMWTVGV